MMCGTGVVISEDMGASSGVRVARVVLRKGLCGRGVRACLVRMIGWIVCALCGVYSLAFGFSEYSTLVGSGPSPVMQPRTAGDVYLLDGCEYSRCAIPSGWVGSTRGMCARSRKSKERSFPFSEA